MSAEWFTILFLTFLVSLFVEYNRGALDAGHQSVTNMPIKVQTERKILKYNQISVDGGSENRNNNFPNGSKKSCRWPCTEAVKHMLYQVACLTAQRWTYSRLILVSLINALIIPNRITLNPKAERLRNWNRKFFKTKLLKIKMLSGSGNLTT